MSSASLACSSSIELSHFFIEWYLDRVILRLCSGSFLVFLVVLPSTAFSSLSWDGNSFRSEGSVEPFANEYLAWCLVCWEHAPKEQPTESSQPKLFSFSKEDLYFSLTLDTNSTVEVVLQCWRLHKSPSSRSIETSRIVLHFRQEMSS